MRALIIAAPASGVGKTVVTLGLLRALRNRGVRVASAKVGPDYIDPRFHEAATGAPCFNLDPWAMDHGLISHLLGQLGNAALARKFILPSSAKRAAGEVAPEATEGACGECMTRGEAPLRPSGPPPPRAPRGGRIDSELVIIEGVMGLFDGPQGARGSTADLAEDFDLPVVLVHDASHQAQSAAALVHGFATFRAGVTLASVILNRVAGERHRDMLNAALKPIGIPVLGHVPRDDRLALPSRHLGLVQASETVDIEAFIDATAQQIAQTIDLDALAALAKTPALAQPSKPLAPLGQRIAIASDPAFAFAYPHLVEGWRQEGAEILLFSPLADEAPDARADAVFLPGGYPELHAGKLASNRRFLNGLRNSSALIYGECGGFMALGEYLIDAAGERHQMAGLLPVGTSFAKRQLHLGYRELVHQHALPWPHVLKGHEFHYSLLDWQGEGDALFTARDAVGRKLGPMGLRRGKVMGSYAHVIA